jgi:hypothetical protein
MEPIQIISQDLFDKIRSRFQNLELGDETGAVTLDPREARFFDFDFVREGIDLGRISISVNDSGCLKVFYSQGITEGKDDVTKKIWFDFLKEMRYFAMRRLLRFDTRDVSKKNLDKNDFQFLAKKQSPKEEQMNTMFESRWNGKVSSKTSRRTQGRTQIIVKHKNKINEMSPLDRSKPSNILAVFIKIVSLKHSTQKEELVYWQKLMQTINSSKDKLFINILNENYVKWVSAKIKRKFVCDLYE